MYRDWLSLEGIAFAALGRKGCCDTLFSGSWLTQGPVSTRQACVCNDSRHEIRDEHRLRFPFPFFIRCDYHVVQICLVMPDIICLVRGARFSPSKL